MGSSTSVVGLCDVTQGSDVVVVTDIDLTGEPIGPGTPVTITTAPESFTMKSNGPTAFRIYPVWTLPSATGLVFALYPRKEAVPPAT